MMTLEEKMEELNHALTVTVSSKTVQCALHTEGDYTRTAKKKPLVSEANHKKRLAWC